MVYYLVTVDDVAVVKALQTGDFAQTTEVNALSVVGRFSVQLHCHVVRFCAPFAEEKLLREGGAHALVLLVEVDRSVAARTDLADLGVFLAERATTHAYFVL